LALAVTRAASNRRKEKGFGDTGEIDYNTDSVEIEEAQNV